MFIVADLVSLSQTFSGWTRVPSKFSKISSLTSWSVEIGKATIVQKDFGSRNSKTSIYVNRFFIAHNVVKIISLGNRHLFLRYIAIYDLTYMEWNVLHGMDFTLSCARLHVLLKDSW